MGIQAQLILALALLTSNGWHHLKSQQALAFIRMFITRFLRSLMLLHMIMGVVMMMMFMMMLLMWFVTTA